MQLDDLDREKLDRVRESAFLLLETSPGNYQAWLAIESTDAGLIRRCRSGVGADKNASGATRIAGSRNIKPKYAPDYPTVELLHSELGLTVSEALLESRGLLSPTETEAPRHAPARRQPRRRTWPSYARCLEDAPAARNHDGKDRSHADFEYALIALDRGWPVERVSERLMRESEKAREEGARYAELTAARAAGVIAKNEPGRFKPIEHQGKHPKRSSYGIGGDRN